MEMDILMAALFQEQLAALMKSEHGPPMTLGSAAAAGLRTEPPFADDPERRLTLGKPAKPGVTSPQSYTN